MKTIKYVVAAYPDGWPSSGDKMVHIFPSGEMYFGDNPDSTAISFTRKEYEQELAKTNTAQWYDYDKQEAISLPPVGVESLWCSHNDDIYTKAIILADVGNDDFVIYAEGYKRIVANPANFRPLDWNKNKYRDEFIKKSRISLKEWNTLEDIFIHQYNAGARFND